MGSIDAQKGRWVPTSNIFTIAMVAVKEGVGRAEVDFDELPLLFENWFTLPPKTINRRDVCYSL